MSDKSDEIDLFDEFWKLYPRREAKVAARKAWTKLTKTIEPQQILDGLAAYAFSPERKFQPLPASWLNGQRWEDETSSASLFDTSKLPEPGAGWTAEQLDMVLGKDTWQVPEPPASMGADDGYMWQQRQKRLHFAERVQAANAKIGRAA